VHADRHQRTRSQAWVLGQVIDLNSASMGSKKQRTSGHASAVNDYVAAGIRADFDPASANRE
jgi:hypothetical protein